MPVKNSLMSEVCQKMQKVSEAAVTIWKTHILLYYVHFKTMICVLCVF